MSERQRIDTDLEFDFFDEPATVETPAREEAPRRRRRVPRRPPSGPGAQGLFRLAVLIGAALLLAVILVLWISSCREEQRRAEYQGYMERIGDVGGRSAEVGRELNNLITTPGISLEDLGAGIQGLRQQQEQILAQAEELQPPGPLRQQQEELVEALQLRVSGLDGLARAFSQVTEASEAQQAGTQLAQQADRLVASDVVYADLFKARAQEVMEREDVQGVDVPDSDFVLNPELGSPRSWTLIVERLTQSPAAGGLHGNQIDGVRVQPGGQALSPTEDNTVTASDRLTFQVIVRNSGDNQETQVKVRLTIQQSPQPITKEQTIDIINPGETKVVAFRGLGQVSFSTRTTVRVIVEPVAGEENTANNTAEYPVIFTLG